MNIRTLLIKSLYSIKAISFFRFQKVEKTIVYLFVLSFLVSLPTLSLFAYGFFSGVKNNVFLNGENTLPGLSPEQIEGMHGSASGMIPVFIFLAILFILLGVSMFQFIFVSLLATIGLWLKHLLGRRTDYKQLWNISAYAVTLPSLLIGLMIFIPIHVPYLYLVYLLASLVLLFLAIRKIPLPKGKR